MSASMARQRFATIMLGAFAAFALTLAVVGVFGVRAHLLTQGAHEIGVRMALGAERRGIVIMVLRQGMELTGAGVVLGLIGAVALTRVGSGPSVLSPGSAGPAGLVLWSWVRRPGGNGQQDQGPWTTRTKTSRTHEPRTQDSWPRQL